MRPPAEPARYKNHRFSGEIISHGVWLYYRFPLSYRDVQELLFERGITVTHEAIRQWCLKFGQAYANQLKGIVKLLGMILSPGNSRHFPDAISADSTLRQPALYSLFQPNSRIAASSLRGTPTRTADAVAVGSVGQWVPMPTKIVGHARGI
jgi:hypothetical protein